jgi:hypothetical protein
MAFLGSVIHFEILAVAKKISNHHFDHLWRPSVIRRALKGLHKFCHREGSPANPKTDTVPPSRSWPLQKSDGSLIRESILRGELGSVRQK